MPKCKIRGCKEDSPSRYGLGVYCQQHRREREAELTRMGRTPGWIVSQNRSKIKPTPDPVHWFEQNGARRFDDVEDAIKQLRQAYASLTEMEKQIIKLEERLTKKMRRATEVLDAEDFYSRA